MAGGPRRPDDRRPCRLDHRFGTERRYECHPADDRHGRRRRGLPGDRFGRHHRRRANQLDRLRLPDPGRLPGRPGQRRDQRDGDRRTDPAGGPIDLLRRSSYGLNPEPHRHNRRDRDDGRGYADRPQRHHLDGGSGHQPRRCSVQPHQRPAAGQRIDGRHPLRRRQCPRGHGQREWRNPGFRGLRDDYRHQRRDALWVAGRHAWSGRYKYAGRFGQSFDRQRRGDLCPRRPSRAGGQSPGQRRLPDGGKREFLDGGCRQHHGPGLRLAVLDPYRPGCPYRHRGPRRGPRIRHRLLHGQPDRQWRRPDHFRRRQRRGRDKLPGQRGGHPWVLSRQHGVGRTQRQRRWERHRLRCSLWPNGQHVRQWRQPDHRRRRFRLGDQRRHPGDHRELHQQPGCQRRPGVRWPLVGLFHQPDDGHPRYPGL